ncbi:MAG: NAD(P)/FAD-dependent oxidoreductase [Acidobacteria bacterium]|nr:NAD(P)/FAD-dependent oxidoreductase [Acidobacteriota bacterium]
METSATKKQILILGGGFAGAYTALHLEKRLGGRPDVEVTLIAKENFVLFTPMLHEVAGGDVEVTDIVHSLRKMLRHTHVAIAEVEAIDLVKKQVRIVHSGLPRAYELTYDHLVLALGAVTNFYGNSGLEKYALTMKTLGDAIIARNRVIDALGLADNQLDENERKKTLTVVVAGGGFAGVETAGALNDLMREAIKFYPSLKEDMLRIVVVHPGEVILPELSESLGHYTEKQLARRGVEVRLKTKVAGYDGKEVTLGDGTKIATRMLIWTAGITPPPLLSSLPCDIQRGRIVANECLQVPKWPGVWALGDCALVPDPLNPGKFYPPTAQHATRQAAVLANNIVAALRGRAPEPFKFKIIGLLATIGRRTGVAEIFGVRFSGIIAWWLWRSIYLSKLPGLQKKVRVSLDWMLDLVFSKDLVQLPTLQATTISEAERSSNPDRARAVKK